MAITTHKEAPKDVEMEQRMHARVRGNLHAIAPYVPGRPIADVQREFGVSTVVKLASNENPTGPSPQAMAAVREMVTTLHRYPDGAAQEIREAIARHADLPIESVLVSNGSDEMIKMVSETFLAPGDAMVIPVPTFPQYAFGAMVMGAEIVEVPLRADFSYDLKAMRAAVTEQTKLVYLCTPNNPTGTWLTHTDVAEFLQGMPRDVVVVLDEAYVEYVDTPDALDAIQFIRDGYTVLSLRTFSKMYGLAGLRLGYALGDPALIRFINQVREPFNANAVAQAAAVAALHDTAHVERCRNENRAGREQMYRGLRSLGLPYIPTQGNFILVEVGDGKAVFDALQRRGVIVRAGFRYLDAYIRISIGSREENEACLAALADIRR